MLVIKFGKKHIFDRNNSKNKELFYTICNNIESNLSKTDSIIMFTSIRQTLKIENTIAYIALAFSEKQKRVLIIDANLRQPSMNDVFKIENSFGLATLLSGRKSQNEIEPVKITEYLYCLPAGQVHFEPSMLFKLESNPALLKDWENSFDIIILHTSNCINSPDAQIIAKHCDSIILLVQEGRDKFGEVMTVKKQLERNKHEIKGTIIIS